MSDILLPHFVSDVFRLPDRQRHDRQRRVLGAAGGELAAVGDEQVLDVVRLAELVARRRRAGSRSSGWCRDCASRDRAASGRCASRRPPRRSPRPACRRGCAWRRRWGGRRNARSATGMPYLSFTVGSSVTRLVSCGMSSPTIHMPGHVVVAVERQVNSRPQAPGSRKAAMNGRPSDSVSIS